MREDKNSKRVVRDECKTANDDIIRRLSCGVQNYHDDFAVKITNTIDCIF